MFFSSMKFTWQNRHFIYNVLFQLVLFTVNSWTTLSDDLIANEVFICIYHVTIDKYINFPIELIKIHVVFHRAKVMFSKVWSFKILCFNQQIETLFDAYAKQFECINLWFVKFSWSWKCQKRMDNWQYFHHIQVLKHTVVCVWLNKKWRSMYWLYRLYEFNRPYWTKQNIRSSYYKRWSEYLLK